jgi:tetratricopeptide (TPR) repeat protein
MKKLIALLAMTAASGMALAQAGGAPAQTTTPQSGQSAPAQAGQTLAQPGQAAQPAAPAGKHQPQAKTQEEFKAYQAVVAKPDPASMETAANEFAQQYATSELKVPLYQQVMLQYQNANNSDKTIEYGRKVLASDGDNVIALVTVASVLANRTRESDLDKEERLGEAKKDAGRVIELINSGEGIPVGYQADRVEAFKNTILAMAYAAQGQADFVNNNFPAAEQSLRKSTSIAGIQPDPVSWFQLTLALDRQGKYADALQAANKCVEVSTGHPVNTYCTQERDRVQKLAAAPPPAAKPAPASPQPTASPTPK